MSSAPPAAAFTSRQKIVVAILAFLQFTIVLDFMLLSPLGAVLMPALNITPAQFGLVVSAYAFSAGVSGILTAGFADRFDRKKLLLVFYGGFLAGTLLCGLVSTYHGLLLARMVAGLFAGVVASTSMAIITDIFPFEMRGRVMGIIQTAFAASSVLGIPLALLLSNHGGWNMPFLLIAGIGVLVGLFIGASMPAVRGHLALHPDRSPLHHFAGTLLNRDYLLGFAATGLLSVGGFMLMPFMSLFTVYNVGIPVEKLPLMYTLTGVASIVTGPLIGRACDSFGKIRMFMFGCAVTIVMVVIYTHLQPVAFATLIAVMVVLHVGIFSRMISSSALLSALPQATDRGAYMSISSSLQQMSGGIAAVIAGAIVVQAPDGKLLHFPTLGYALICTTLLTLVLIALVDRKVRGAGATLVPGAALASE
ncbi:MAG: MFS transporter [Steroidobacteraceae bacterium]